MKLNKCNTKGCKNKFPNTITIDGKTRNLSSRSKCLDCSPFKTAGEPMAALLATDVAKHPEASPQKESDNNDSTSDDWVIVFERRKDNYHFKVYDDGSIELKTYAPVTLTYNPNSDIDVFKFNCYVNDIKTIKSNKREQLKKVTKDVDKSVKELTKEQQDIIDDYDSRLFEYDILGIGEYPGDKPIFN